MTPGKTGFYHMPKTQTDLDADILEVFEDVSAVATALKAVIDPLNQKISDLQAQNDALTAKIASIGAEPPPAPAIDFTPETDQLDKIHAGLQALAESPNAPAPVTPPVDAGTAPGIGNPTS